MKLYFHYYPWGYSNCYILGTDSPSNDAIIIDPGNVDSNLISLIEDNNYTLRGVLITHDHAHHVRGLKTIMRVYDTTIYAINPMVMEYRCTHVKDGDTIDIGPFRAEVIAVPGHSADSAVYKIDRLLFTGDTPNAGFVGSTASSYAALNQINALRGKLLSLPGDYTILPGHGPPSSLEVERRLNLGLKSFEEQKKNRPVIRFEF